MADEVGSLRVKLGLDTLDFSTGMATLSRNMQRIGAEFRNASVGLDKVRDAAKIAALRITELTGKIEVQKEIIDEISIGYENYKAGSVKSAKATEEWETRLIQAQTTLKKMEQELVDATAIVKKHENAWLNASKGLQAFSDRWSKAGKSMITAGKSMTTTITAPLLALGGAATKFSIDFETAFAGVTKTVDGTAGELALLKQGIRDMTKEIPASAVEIAAVAEAAGQLGIKTDNVLDFTRVMIDLGQATNLAATEGAQTLARFANITQMSQKDFSRLGSAIVELGNNSATTEAEIAAMALRLAGAGEQIGMSESEILGIAAALSSVGIEAEAGGSAISKVMVEMQLAVATGGQALDDFAKVAGMSSEAFSAAFKTDAAGALSAFVAGLGSMGERGEDAIVVLDSMGITEVRMRDALLRSANAGDLLAESIRMSNEAWEENNALTEEAEKRYATNESQLKIQINRIKDAAIVIGDLLVPMVADLTKWFANLAEKVSNMSPFMQRLVIVVAGLAAVAGPATVTVGTLVRSVGDIAGVAGKASAAIGKAGGLTAFLGTKAGLAGVAGVAVGVIAGLVGVISAVTQKSRDATKETIDLVEATRQTGERFTEQTNTINASSGAAQKLTESLFDLNEKEVKSNADKVLMTQKLKQLNEMYPELTLSIDEQTGALNMQESAVLDVIEANKQLMLMKASNDSLQQLYQDGLILANELVLATERANEARKVKWTNQSVIEYFAELRESKIALDTVNQGIEENRLLTIEAEKSNAQMAEQMVENIEIVVEAELFGWKLVKLDREEKRKLDEDESRRTKELLDKRLEDYKEYADNYEAAKSEHLSNMGGLDDEGITKTKLTAKEIMRNLRKQIADFQEWRRELRQLSSRVPQDVMQELKALGPAFEPVLEDLNNMSDDKLNEFIVLWRTKGAEAAAAAMEDLLGLPAKAEEVGENFGKGFVKGMNRTLASIKAEAKRMAKTATGAMENELETASPSKKTDRIGQNTGHGFINGMAKTLDLIRSTGRKMATAALPGTDPSVQSMRITPPTVTSVERAVAAQGRPAISDMGETNALLRQLLAVAGNPAPGTVTMDGRTVGDVLLPGILQAGSRQNKAWPVKARP
jgi:TP901 family phage tail tape measure protein